MATPNALNILQALGGGPVQTPEPSGLQRFGRALQGLGAGFTGQLPQFQAVQERRMARESEERQRLSRERLQAAAIDARVTSDFLRAGDIRSAMTLLDNRIDSINALGGDPSDTAALRERLAGGDVAGVLGELDRVDTIATTAGLIEGRPAATASGPEILKQSEIGPSGQVVERDPATGRLTVRRVEGFEAPPEEEETPPPVQFGGQVLVRDEEGNQFFSTTARNPATGRIETRFANLTPGGPAQPVGRAQVVSSLGQTAEERVASAGERARAQALSKAQVDRFSQQATQGLNAADSTAVLRRSLDLLDSVETGGFDAAATRARQLFGIESADEGELSSNLGKAVLSQLRATFGAAFTEREGARLESLEAGLGRSPEANKRIITNALEIANRAANRGINAAEQLGDSVTAQEIRDALVFELSDEAIVRRRAARAASEAPPAAPEAPALAAPPAAPPPPGTGSVPIGPQRPPPPAPMPGGGVQFMGFE